MVLHTIAIHEAGHFIEYCRNIVRLGIRGAQARLAMRAFSYMTIMNDGTSVRGLTMYRILRDGDGPFILDALKASLLAGMAYEVKIAYRKERISWIDVIKHFRKSCRQDVFDYLRHGGSIFRIRRDAQKIMDSIGPKERKAVVVIYNALDPDGLAAGTTKRAAGSVFRTVFNSYVSTRPSGDEERPDMLEELFARISGNA